MRKAFFIIIGTLFWACGHTGGDFVDGVIVFDNSKTYPELELKLSDVADITYIPLKGVDEGYPVSAQFKYQGNNACIYDDEIYFISNSTVLCVFDMSGNPVRQLDRRGRGPEEYGQGILNFWVEPETNSVYVVGDNRMIVEYDASSFEFKGRYPRGFESTPSDIISLNRDYLAIHRKRPLSGEKAPATFYVLSKSDWKAQHLSPQMERPYDFDDSFLLTYPGLTRGRSGVFMNNTRCDTVWWINRETLDVGARMVDKTDYPGRNMMVLPSFETDRYLFFSLLYQRFEWRNNQPTPINEPWPEDRMFVFDKGKEKIFRIPLTRTDSFPRNDSSIIERKFAWAFDECWLTCWHTTLNGNYGIAMYQAYELLDNIDSLPPELKQIVATLEEYDNPVLALIKLKE
jgi:hypothetical protein